MIVDLTPPGEKIERKKCLSCGAFFTPGKHHATRCKKCMGRFYRWYIKTQSN